MAKYNLYALCYSSEFQFESLQKFLLESERCTAYRKVLHIDWKEGNVFLFDYGVIVFWNLSLEARSTFLQKIAPFSESTIPHLLDDTFSYEGLSENFTVKNDHITLDNADIESLLAISHAIAQSTKLAQFEWEVQQTISETAHIPLNIAKTGKSKLNRTELAQLRGKLFIAQSNIMLNYDLLDIPDFFWEYPELSHYYNRVSEYLEIKQRIEVLSKKLETIHELFDMMSDEQKHKHSSLLEWIIIWLITFEVAVTIFHDLLKWF